MQVDLYLSQQQKMWPNRFVDTKGLASAVRKLVREGDLYHGKERGKHL